MPAIAQYHRPSTLDEAVGLLGRDEVKMLVIAGGTLVNAGDLMVGTEVVDIQTAVSGVVERVGDRFVMGAMARIQDVIEHPAAPALIVEVARREGPNTFRNAATIGGTVAGADAESELIAGLLVHEAVVSIVGPDGGFEMPIAEVLGDRAALSGAIIVSVSVAMEGRGASARTGRTPADTSIVAAIGRRGSDGLLLALTGVAATPVLVHAGDLGTLDPPPDFRGTAAYRRKLAEILMGRVVAELGGQS